MYGYMFWRVQRMIIMMSTYYNTSYVHMYVYLMYKVKSLLFCLSKKFS